MKKYVLAPFVLPLALACGGCFHQAKDASTYISEARAFLADRNDAKAEAVLQQALRVYPRDAQANFLLAEIEDRRGDLEDAVPGYLRAIANSATLLEPHLRVIQILLDAGRLSDASTNIDVAVTRFPKNLDLIALRASLEQKQGKVAAATADANAVLSKDPYQAQATAVLATSDLAAHNAPAALERVERALSKHPDDLQLLQVQAVAALTADQPDTAEQALASIVERSPRNVSALMALARIHLKDGDPNGAMDVFKTAVAANPDDEKLQLTYAAFLEDQKGFGEATSYLNQLIARDPEHSAYDMALAGLFRVRKQLDESKAVLERAAARLKPGRSRSLVVVTLARIEGDQGRYDLALATLNSVLSTDPSNTDALFGRAQLNYQGGRAKAAIDDLLTLGRSDPVNGPAYKLLAAAYLAAGEKGLALDAMKRAVAVLPADMNASLDLAAFMQRAGQSRDASEYITRLTLQRPGDLKVWAAAAEIAMAAKNWDVARRSIKKLEDLPGGNALALAVRGQLSVAQGDFAGGLQSYEAALGLQSDISLSLISAISQAAIAAGQPAEAADRLSEAASKLKPVDQPSCWLAILGLEAAAKRPDKVEAAFNRAVGLAPDNLQPYADYIQYLVSEKAFDHARQVLAAGTKANAPHYGLLMLQGLVEQFSGDVEAAASSYREALTANPTSLAAANNYASVIVDRDKTNLNVLSELRSRLAGAETSRDYNVIDTIAWLDFRLGRFDEAKMLLSGIKAGDSQDPQIRFHMAAVLLASGDKAQAQAILASLKGLTFPGSDEARSLSAT